MTAWTSPKTWTSGNTLTAAELNEQVRDNESNLDERLTAAGITSGSPTSLKKIKSAAYGCILRRTADVTIGNASTTSLNYPTGSMTEIMDTDSFHSGASNTARITIPSGGDGWYIVFADIEFAADADGYREATIEKNGIDGAGTLLASQRHRATDTGNDRVHVCSVVSLAATDYVVCSVRHTAGAALDVVAAADYSPVFGCVRLFAS